MQHILQTRSPNFKAKRLPLDVAAALLRLGVFGRGVGCVLTSNVWHTSGGECILILKGASKKSISLPSGEKTHVLALCRMLHSWLQAVPQLQQLGRIDPQVMAGVLQAQPQLVTRMQQQAASHQLLQVHANCLAILPQNFIWNLTLEGLQ